MSQLTRSVGTLVGAVAGGAVGAKAGGSIAEAVNPTEYNDYFEANYKSEPYYQQGRQFEDYQQAYQTGEQGRQQYGSGGQSFSQAESNLRGDYENATRSNSNALKWQEGAGQACQAAWDRAGSQGQSQDRDMQQQGKIHGESTGRTS